MPRRGILLVAGMVVVIGAAAGSFVLLRGSSGGGGGTPRFVEETAAAGIAQTYDGDAMFDTGGGVAVFDCDGDGRPDLYFAGGSNPAVLYRNASPVGGALRFAAAHDPATDLAGVTGAYPFDLDGDGVTDLAVLRAGENMVLRGLGGCRFERANEAFGLDAGTGLTNAFSATWEGANRLPTLVFGRFRQVEPDGDLSLDCDSPLLVRPDVGGERYAAPVALEPGFCPLSVLFSDWAGTGQPDLRVSNDRNYYLGGQEQLWRIVPGEAPRLYTAAEGWASVQIQGMGIGSYDLAGDGTPDYFLASQADNRLQELTGGPGAPAYQNIALKRGVNSARPGAGDDVLPSTTWHPDFQDVNNDGLIDLLLTKGNPSAVPEYASRDPSSLFLGQADGRFTDVAEAAGIVVFDRGRGAAFADFNLDGLLDLVEVFYQAPVRVWRNVGAGDAGSPRQMGHWLAVRLSQPGGNVGAVGSWIEVESGGRVARRELTVGGGHASGTLGWVHVGLGTADGARVRVRWPDGTVGPWLAVGADSFVVVEKGAEAVTRWDPGAP